MAVISISAARSRSLTPNIFRSPGRLLQARCILLNSGPEPRKRRMTPDQSRQTAEEHYYAALDLYAEGHHQEAIRQYEAAIAADPSFLDAMRSEEHTSELQSLR